MGHPVEGDHPRLVDEAELAGEPDAALAHEVGHGAVGQEIGEFGGARDVLPVELLGDMDLDLAVFEAAPDELLVGHRQEHVPLGRVHAKPEHGGPCRPLA